MTGRDLSQRLERHYRRLLFAYPAAYRAERGDELIATLLSAAPPGRGAPSVAEMLDLVYNGLRTRARVTRHASTSPIAASALRHAGLVSLTVAAAAAVAVVVGVAVLGQSVFGPGRYSNGSYPVATRVGLGAVLAAFPAALVSLLAGRVTAARRFAAMGAMGSAGFAAWLVTHALSTRTEHLEASNLFGLVALFCAPAALLAWGPAAGERVRIGRWAASAILLAACFALLVSGNALVTSNRIYDDQVTVLRGPGTLHDSGLTQAIAVVVAVVGAWHLARGLARRNDPRPPAVAFAMSIPPLGYALGTFLTPIFFRPELVALPHLGRWTELAPHLLEVALALALPVVLACLALGSVQRVLRQPV